MLVMRALQSDVAPTRWYWMQYLGMGSILLPLVAIGFALRLFLSSPIVALLVIAAWAILLPIAWYSAHKIHNKHLKIETEKAVGSKRLIQISDVHIGSRSAQFLEKVVAQVLSHDPDIVLITGDLLDASRVTETHLAGLKKIQCPTLMCIGNHERYVKLDAAIDAIEANDVQVLRDAASNIEHLRFTSLDDRDNPHALPEVLTQIEQDNQRFNIGLYHRPDGWAALRQHGCDLTLAGHTHAGQIWPFGFFVKRQYPTMVGWFETNGQALYVSPGTGTWGPIFRLGTRCEMTVIDIVS